MSVSGAKGRLFLAAAVAQLLSIVSLPAIAQDIFPGAIAPVAVPDRPSEKSTNNLIVPLPAPSPDAIPGDINSVGGQDKQPDTPPAKPPDKPPDKPPAKSLLDLDLEQLGNVPVRPQTQPQGAVTPTPVGTSITPTQSESAQSSTADLFNRSSSVSLRRTSALGLDPQVRGYHAGQINGNASGMTQYRSRVDIDSLFSQIDAGNIESVNVIDGPYTSVYGPGFAFLSVDLIRPRRYANGPETHASTLLTYGTNGSTLYNRDRVWGGGASWGFDVSYGLRVGNDYTSGSPGAFRVPASYNQQDVYAALSFDLGRESRVDLNYVRLGLRNVELPGVAYDINRQTTDQFNIRWVWQEDPDELEKAVLQFWTQRTPFHADSTRPSKQETMFRTLVADPLSGSVPGFTNIVGTGLTESWGLRALRTFGCAASPQLTIGADWRHLRQSYGETNFDGNGGLIFPGTFFGIPESQIGDFGILTHLKLPATQKLDVTFGGRYDYAYTSLADPQSLVVQPPPFFTYRPGINQPAFSLFMGYGAAEYRPLDYLKVNAGIGYAMRAPNLSELYSAATLQPIARFGNSHADGNSQLSPERNLQLDLGTTYQRDRWVFGVRGFCSMIHDYILPIPSNFIAPFPAGLIAPTNLHRDYAAFGISSPASTAALSYRYSNIGLATLAGGEVNAQFRLSDWITISADLAYVKGVNHDPSRYDFPTNQVIPIKGAEGLPGIYPFNTTVRLLIAEPVEKKWGVEAVARIVHRQDFVADSLGELTTAGFTEFNLHGHYQINKHLRVFSSIQNLFNTNFTEHGSLVISNPQGTILRFVPERGFTLILGMEARY